MDSFAFKNGELFAENVPVGAISHPAGSPAAPGVAGTSVGRVVVDVVGLPPSFTSPDPEFCVT